MKIVLVAGARPNFMKIAPILRAMRSHNLANCGPRLEPLLVHTGQHYDYEMSQVFFEDLDLPIPDIYLGVGSGSHAEQTGKVMIETEKVLLQQKPDLVMVVGDVNSTLAAALAAAKLHIPVAHVEAGIRNGDMSMPEEVNRLLTDLVSDYLFTTSHYDDENLTREGIPVDKIYRVGNVMVDCLLSCKEAAAKSGILGRLDLKPQKYALLTLHRPANVDDADKLETILSRVKEAAGKIQVVFPAHPRTHKKLAALGSPNAAASESNPIIASHEAARRSNPAIITPVGYRDMLNLEMNAIFIITDSGGVQVEATVLGIPCLTVMDRPVWLITHDAGNNVLVGSDCLRLAGEVGKIMGRERSGEKAPVVVCPELWDGRAGERIVEAICAGFCAS